MPAYEEGTRRKHKEKERSRHDGKGQEVARRSQKYDDYSESEPDSRPKGSKSKSMSKKDSKSKDKQKKSKRRASSDEEEESDNEQIVTKRNRYEDVDIDQLEPNFRRILKSIFQITDRKIDSYCHDGLIRLDTKDGSFDVSKMLKKAEPSEIEEWAKYEKRWKRMNKESMEVARGSGYYGASSSYGDVVDYYDYY